MAKVRLHRCSTRWLKSKRHPCWCVEKALIDAGIDYEVVVAPRRKGDRADVERLTGQALLPAIELADGTGYREESTVMAERIRAGRLFEGREG
jgi:hypothetical protein